MSSSSIPAASAASVAKASSSSSSTSRPSQRSLSRFSALSLRPSSTPNAAVSAQRTHYQRSVIVKAQQNEVQANGSTNGSANTTSKSEVPQSEEKDIEVAKEQPASGLSFTESSIGEFMAEVASLVELVDSRDIVELHLKQQDCEIIIKKKEALPQPPAPTPVVMMHSPPAQGMVPTQMPPAAAHSPAPQPSPSTVSPLALPPPTPKSNKPSHPPLKCPMAGTFYRCPGPGQPPFVKVGDKVKKGQVLCIVEAMKLMNEVEAPHPGTIVDVLLDDGKPVSMDTPLFIIEPSQ